MAVLSDKGSVCSQPLCQLRDFLPFKCEKCKKVVSWQKLRVSHRNHSLSVQFTRSKCNIAGFPVLDLFLQFCLEHSTFDKHDCPLKAAGDRRVYVCPICLDVIQVVWKRALLYKGFVPYEPPV